MTVEPVTGEPSPELDTIPESAAHEPGEITRAARIIALGNIASRLLGLVRETVKSHLFGAGAVVDAYGVATFVPTQLYDLIVGGMVNGALVPIFSELKEKDEAELWRLAATLINLMVLALAAFVLIVEVFAEQLVPPVARFMLTGHTSPEALMLAAQLLRITVPAVLFLSLSGVISGLLYALKRFAYPAFTTAIYNTGIVVMALLLYKQFGIAAMAIGLLVGSGLQVVMQLPGLRGTGMKISLRLWHPGLGRVFRLYLPTLVPLLIDVLISRTITLNLASQTGQGGISYMGYATYLTQLPQGLVATAVSLAVLPTLAAQAALEVKGQIGESFRATLAQGLRLVIVLIIPAAVGLYVLAQPTIVLLYEHGDFLRADTLMTAWALRFYLIGLPFAAVDLLLVYTFYARQDTLTPALIGVGSICVYLLLASGLLPTWGLFALMIADTFKHFLHTSLSGILLMRRVKGIRGYGVLRTLGIVIGAAALMGAVVYGINRGVMMIFPSGNGLAQLLAVAAPALVGGGVYLGIVSLLGVEEIGMLWRSIRSRLTG